MSPVEIKDCRSTERSYYTSSVDTKVSDLSRSITGRLRRRLPRWSFFLLRPTRGGITPICR